jgi:hypothetical protein
MNTDFTTMRVAGESTIVRVPSGTPGSGMLELDLTEVVKLESRKDEVASVTKTKSAELLRAMEKGYSALSRYLPKVQLELTRAKSAADERKAVVLLDEVPEILKAKGLARASQPGGSVDQREAILALDKEHQALRETVAQLDALYELLRGKQKGFEMAYHSIKKLYGDADRYGTSAGTYGGIQDGVGAGEEESAQPGSFTGLPRYR